MATGIVSVAAFQHRQGALSTVLFMIGLSTYAVLAALMMAYLTCRPGRVRCALASPSARLESLTVVTASTVLGVRAVLGGAVWAGAVLGWWPCWHGYR